MRAIEVTARGREVTVRRGRGESPVNVKQLRGQEAVSKEQEIYLKAVRQMARTQLDMKVKMKIMARERVNKHEVIDFFLDTLGSAKTRKQYEKSILDYIEWYNQNGDLKERHNILLSERSDAIRYLNYCKAWGEKHRLSFNWFVCKHRALGSLFTFLESNYGECFFTNIFRNSKVKYSEFNTEGELFKKEVVLIMRREIESIKKELLIHQKHGGMYAIAVDIMSTIGLRVGGLKSMVIRKDKGGYKFKTISKGRPYEGVIANRIIQDMTEAGLDFEKPFKDFNQSTLQKAVDRIKKDFNMDFTSGCHAFRHFAAVTLYKKTKDTLLVGEMLNHKNQQTTSIYLRHIGLDIQIKRNL